MKTTYVCGLALLTMLILGCGDADADKGAGNTSGIGAGNEVMNTPGYQEKMIDPNVKTDGDADKAADEGDTTDPADDGNAKADADTEAENGDAKDDAKADTPDGDDKKE